MAITGYGIGLSSGNILQLLQQNPVIPPPYPVEYLPYTEIAGENGLGEPIEVGPPTLTWRWDKLTLRQYNFFLGLCTGASVPAFVSSRVEGGTDLEFGIFSVIMWRPKSGVKQGPLRSNVEIQFRQLVRLA